MSSNNFPPDGSYEGRLCGITRCATQSGDPALLIRFAVITEEGDQYAPTAFWSFSEKAEKHIREHCKDIEIKYGALESIRQQLEDRIGTIFNLSIETIGNGFQQVEFYQMTNESVENIDDDDDEMPSTWKPKQMLPQPTERASSHNPGVYVCCPHCQKPILIGK